MLFYVSFGKHPPHYRPFAFSTSSAGSATSSVRENHSGNQHPFCMGSIYPPGCIQGMHFREEQGILDELRFGGSPVDYLSRLQAFVLDSGWSFLIGIIDQVNTKAYNSPTADDNKGGGNC